MAYESGWIEPSIAYGCIFPYKRRDWGLRVIGLERNYMVSDSKAQKQRAKRACVQCKLRKKKCSGELPCSYCLKIQRGQHCEYRPRFSSKTVTVSLRYLRSLKLRIQQLERKSTVSQAVENTLLEESDLQIVDKNPLVESDDEATPLRGDATITEPVENDVGSDDTKKHYLGVSSCPNFLSKICDVFIASGLSSGQTQGVETKLTYLEASIEAQELGIEAKNRLPSIDKAYGLIKIAEKTIGADYMYIEPDYVAEVMRKRIYAPNIPQAETEAIEYMSEMARIYAYLALGSLFSHKSEPILSPGLQYYKTGLMLQASLLRDYDHPRSDCFIQTYLYLAFYSLSLNKLSFAFSLVGISVRTMLSLGYHKRTVTFAQNRSFWLCFIYDRLLSIRVGLPAMIDDADIEIPFFQLETLSLNNYYFSSHVKLAKITTLITTELYNKNAVSFLPSCHKILKRLKSWLEELPQGLGLDYDNIKKWETRSIYNLHINYHFLIIITTRPVLFYVFKKVLIEDKDADNISSAREMKIVNALVRACTEAAEILSRVLTQLFYDGDFAVCSFLDCHFVFSATIILILRTYCQTIPNNELAYGTDKRELYDLIQSNLKILWTLSAHNHAAASFSNQLTEFIKLIKPEGSLDYMSTDSSRCEAPSFDLSDTYGDEKQGARGPLSRDKPFEPFGIVDISQLLSNISSPCTTDSLDPFFNERGFFDQLGLG